MFCSRKDTFQKKSFACQRDGLTLRGMEYRPQGNNLPIALVCHGFMANQKTVQHYARLFAGLGYAAYCFDFSGGCVMMGKSDGKTTDMSVLTEGKDLKAVVDYAKGLPYTNAEDVTLMGCSQGGFVSALVASDLKQQVKKLVLFYPALCIPDDARAGKMMFAKFDPQNLPEVINCGPMKLGKCYAADVIDMDPFAEIKGYTGDVLIVQGTADKIVHTRYAKRAYETYLNRETGTVRLRLIDGGGHMFSKKHDVLAMDELNQFLAE